MNAGPHHVLLMRHGHAEWPSYAGVDFDRPLTPQGLADAAAAAAAIRECGHRPDQLLTSTARRTLQTSEIVARTLDLPASAIRRVDSLYNAPVETLQAQLLHAFTLTGTVMIVAHNPGISELARELTHDRHFAAFRPAQWLYLDHTAL